MENPDFYESTGQTHRHRSPPRFCNKQRSALFTFRKCPLFLKGKSAFKVSCPPKFEMLPTSWSDSLAALCVHSVHSIKHQFLCVMFDSVQMVPNATWSPCDTLPLLLHCKCALLLTIDHFHALIITQMKE